MLFSVLALTAGTSYFARVAGDSGAPPANVPLSFDSASGRYVASVVMGGTLDKLQTVGFTISTGLRYSAVASSNFSAYTQANTQVYNPNASPSFQSLSGTATNDYGGLDIGGGLGRESCGLKQIDPGVLPWQWPNQTLVLSNATQSALRLFSGSITGVMGLATSPPEGGSALDTVLGHWLQMHSTNTTFQYGMALDDRSSTLAQQALSPNDSAGHLHMAAPNTTFFDPVKVVWSNASTTLIGGGGSFGALTSDFAFILQNSSFTTPDQLTIASGDPAQATFEPLFPALIFPARFANLIYASIDGAQPIQSTNPAQWMVPCNTTGISWTPAFGSLKLPMSNLITKASSGEMCSCVIQAWTDESISSFMLGSPFMTNAYIIHSTSRTGQNQVGIAPRLPLGTRSAKSKKALIGGLVGGIVGGLLLLGILVFVCWKKLDRKERTYANETAEVRPFVAPAGVPNSPELTSTPYTTPPNSAGLMTSTSMGSFAQQQATDVRGIKGRNLYTQANPAMYQASSYQPSTYSPSTFDDMSQDDGRSVTTAPLRSPLLPPAYE